MHKKIAKAVASSAMAAAMLTTTVATVAPMSVSAGNCLGESDFTTKGLPWHTCETSPAKQTFGLTDNGTYLCTIKNPGGANRGGESRWDLQFRHRKLKIQKGHTYKIHWEVTASTAGNMATQIASLDGESQVAWHNNATDFNQGWDNVQISAGKNVFDSEFTSTVDIEVAEWAFHYGGAGEWQPADCFPEGTTLEWDNMTLECTTCGDAYSEGSCNWDPSDDFGVRTRDNSGLKNNFISVNQVGYFTNLAKKATLGDNAGGGDAETKITLPTTAMDFDLVDASGKVVYSGKTEPKGQDSASGDYCHVLDFSDYKTPGTYSLKCGDYVSFEFEIGDDLFSKKGHDLLTNAMNYYYQNRSGINIEEAYITSRDDIKSSLAHVGGHNPDEAYVQPEWVKSYAGEFDGDTSYTIDGVGGWYDAGDHGKYVVNGGISVWTLQNIYERSLAAGDASKFADGSGAVVVPEAGNGAPDILDEARVEVEWMMNMVVDSKDPHWGDKAGLVYHKLHDHKWTGLATRPYDYVDQWGTTRIVKPPSFAATLNFVACAAQAARLWEEHDPTFAKECLAAAKSSYEAFQKHFYEYPGEAEGKNPTSLYAPMDQAIGGGAYGDTNVKDDAYWAAAELFATTGDSTYYDDMKGYEHAFEVVTKIEGGENNGSWGSFNWGNTSSLGSISLLLNEDKIDAADIENIEKSLKSAADAYVAKENEQGYGIPYDTAKFTDPVNIGTDAAGNPIVIDGYEWGSNSFVINNAIVMAYAYDITEDVTYLNGVAGAMDYLLGRNPLSFSYVTGYGDYTLERPHHRYWSNELDKEFPEAPDGILSGGPGSGMQDPYIGGLGFERGKLAPQRCYVDSIEAWSVNEITINWNAPLVWVASFMQDEAAVDGNVTPTDPTKDTDPTEDTDPTDPTQPSSEDPTGDTGEVGTANTDKELVDKAHWGDCNVDGTVDVADIVALNMYLLNASNNALEEQGIVNANCNYDAKVDSSDSVIIMNYVAMIIEYGKLGPQ